MLKDKLHLCCGAIAPMLLALLVANAAWATGIEETPVFRAGDLGYACFRIPAVVKTTSGTVIAFAEGRKLGAGDSGPIDLMCRRSTDDGRTWSELQMVWSDNGNTCGNPAPVQDRATGRVHLLMTRNLGTDTEKHIGDGTSSDTRRVFIAHSDDEGAHWSSAEEITTSVKSPDWSWYATGPGHGIQLDDGRLVIPCNHSMRVGTRGISSSHVIASDDHGATWHAGASVGEHTNESTVLELASGELYLNARSYRGLNRRAFAWSKDRGESWSPVENDPVLIEPVCQGSSLRHRRADGSTIYLFSNPASTSRTLMTVRTSDDCKTWSAGRLIHPGMSAYSDMCSLTSDSIGLLYERDYTKTQCGTITFARLPLGWLEQ